MGLSSRMTMILIIMGCTRYAQYVTLLNGYRNDADSSLFT